MVQAYPRSPPTATQSIRLSRTSGAGIRQPSIDPYIHAGAGISATIDRPPPRIAHSPRVPARRGYFSG
jgi:hypothetical protein